MNASRIPSSLHVHNSSLWTNVAGDGGGAFFLEAASRGVFRGLHVWGGSSQQGGFVKVVGNSVVHASHSEVHGCSASGGGGAIYSEGSSVSLTGLEFTACKSQASSGGTVYASSRSKVTVTSSVLSGDLKPGVDRAKLGGSLSPGPHASIGAGVYASGESTMLVMRHTRCEKMIGGSVGGCVFVEDKAGA
jgi:hypothetical protein